MFRKITLALLLASSFCFAVSINPDLSSPSDIEVNNAYAKTTPPNVKNSAVFMDIKNNLATPIRLVEVSSDVSEVSEIHTHEHVDGMMKMVQIDAIEIPSQVEANLEPGGLHLMLINLKKPLREGDKINVTIKFDNGMSIDLTDVPVKTVVKQQHKH